MAILTNVFVFFFSFGLREVGTKWHSYGKSDLTVKKISDRILWYLARIIRQCHYIGTIGNHKNISMYDLNIRKMTKYIFGDRVYVWMKCTIYIYCPRLNQNGVKMWKKVNDYIQSHSAVLRHNSSQQSMPSIPLFHFNVPFYPNIPCSILPPA